MQFFVGDMVEAEREGQWCTARVARAPTDERPGDGSFTIKWDSDAVEMKCWYKDLRKPRNPAAVPLPAWIEDWWPEEPPPEEKEVGGIVDLREEAKTSDAPQEASSQEEAPAEAPSEVKPKRGRGRPKKTEVA